MTDLLPKIIQGGMGVAVSDWRLARSVAREGQLGVVSGTALDVVLVRRLQLGDLDGSIRQAMAMFPYEEIADRILDKYFIPGGKSDDDSFQNIPMLNQNPSHHQLELLVVANFVEVHLAKAGHDGVVGVNFLEKIQLPTIPSVFGAMLAGVDYVLMGAGIPKLIPEILDRLAEGQDVNLPLTIAGALGDRSYTSHFSPTEFSNGRVPWLTRPKFLPIVSSATLATMLARKSNGQVDGFVVEGHTAGGHNAPPRGSMALNQRGEPVYGPRDELNLAAFRKIGLPFWLAGSFGTPDGLAQALALGAAGIQVGTAFAFCDESGMRRSIKRQAIQMSKDQTTDIFTDPVASPTGFPFKLLQLNGSHSDTATYENRKRVCDLGYLRHAYIKSDGTLGWRCPSEPTDTYVKKGGKLEDTTGRKCVCNGLLANVGLGQNRKTGGQEKFLVTCGNEARNLVQFLNSPDQDRYKAKDVIEFLLAGVLEPPGNRSAVPLK